LATVLATLLVAALTLAIRLRGLILEISRLLLTAATLRTRTTTLTYNLQSMETF
jgi:hypothetical protein